MKLIASRSKQVADSNQDAMARIKFCGLKFEDGGMADPGGDYVYASYHFRKGSDVIPLDQLPKYIQDVKKIYPTVHNVCIDEFDGGLVQVSFGL